MAKIIVLHPEVAVESATELAKALKSKIDNPYNSDNRDYSKFDVIFKYGFSRPIKAKKGALVLNKTKAVEISMDKQKTFALFQDDNFCVPYTTDKAVAKEWLKKGTVVARTDAKASNGIGVHYCDTVAELNAVNGAIFWTKFVDHTNEFRINVWRDKVVSIYDKVVPNEHFRFKLFKGAEDNPQLVEMVRTVYQKTGLDWYGLDVLRDKKGRLHLLEINSCPVLFPYTINKLTTIINDEIQALEHA